MGFSQVCRNAMMANRADGVAWAWKAVVRRYLSSALNMSLLCRSSYSRTVMPPSRKLLWSSDICSFSVWPGAATRSDEATAGMRSLNNQRSPFAATASFFPSGDHAAMLQRLSVSRVSVLYPLRSKRCPPAYIRCPLGLQEGYTPRIEGSRAKPPARGPCV